MFRRIVKGLMILLLVSGLFIATLHSSSSYILERYHTEIATLIKQKVGADVTYSSAWFQIVPSPKIFIGDFALSKQQHNLDVTIGKLEISLKALPLLTGEIQIPSIALHAPHIAYKVPSAPSKSSTTQDKSSTTLDNSASAPPVSAQLQIDDFLISDGSLEISSQTSKEKGALKLENINFNSTLSYIEDQVIINNGSFSDKDASLNFAVNFNIQEGNGDISLNAHHLVLNNIAKALKIILHQQGEMTGRFSTNLSLQVKQHAVSHIKGDLNLEDLSLSQNGGHLKMKTLELKEFDLDLNNTGKIIAEIKTNLAQLEINTPDQEGYKAEKGFANLSLIVEHNNIGITGDADVTGFGYHDDTTQIQKVNGKLTNIKGKIDAASNANFKLYLDGHNIDLIAPNIHINQADSVKSPLTVIIPSAGGYIVEGPLTLKNGGMDIAQKKLTSLDGTIDMYISSPSSRFKSNDISGTIENEQVTLPSLFFEMTRSDYIVHQLDANAFGGNLSATFDMGRKGKPLLSVSLSAKQAAIEKALAIYDKDLAQKIGGTITTLDSSVTSERPKVFETLSGHLNITLQNGLLDKYSVDNQMREALSNLPVIGDDFKFNPSSGKEGDDYIVDGASRSRTLTLQTSIGNGSVNIDKLFIDGTYGNINGTGHYNFEKGLALKGALVFLQDSFQDLAGPLEELGKFFGELGRVEIPFLVTGPVNKISVRGDLSRILDVFGPTHMIKEAAEEIVDAVEGDSNPDSSDD